MRERVCPKLLDLLRASNEHMLIVRFRQRRRTACSLPSFFPSTGRMERICGEARAIAGAANYEAESMPTATALHVSSQH